jgi:hypothetical protein
MKSKSNLIEVPEYFWNYINLVKEDDLLKAMKDQRNQMMNMLLSVPQNKEDFAYANGKWTIKQLMLHINDAERIFTYRALRFARKDQTNLPGFDEDFYAANAEVNHRSLTNIADEFFSIRNASIHFFESMPDDTMQRIGSANEKNISVGALGFCIVGHAIHHKNVLKEKYGIK